jgi:hypothetical protein
MNQIISERVRNVTRYSRVSFDIKSFSLPWHALKARLQRSGVSIRAVFYFESNNKAKEKDVRREKEHSQHHAEAFFHSSTAAPICM